MKHKTILILIMLILGCSSRKKVVSDNYGDTRTIKVKMLNSSTYLLTETAVDSTYAYNMNNPVKVGQMSPANEQKYMNALLGPKGEKTKYRRLGSCCAFSTPNGIIDNAGLLDIYELVWVGSKDTLKIYINMYDKGNLYIPKGLTARKK